MPMLDLPVVIQRDSYSCGPACVRCVLEHYGQAGVHRSVAAQVGTTPMDGTDPRALEGFLRRVGYRVQSGEMELADLVHHAKLGRPIICLVTFGEGHYVVVRGVHRGRVHLMDPWEGITSRSIAEFQAAWRVEGDRWGCRYEQFGIVAMTSGPNGHPSLALRVRGRGRSQGQSRGSSLSGGARAA